MPEIRVSELSGEALNWAVAKAVPQKHWPVIIKGEVMLDTDFEHYRYSPSTDWTQGGPLLTEWAVEFEWVTDATIRAFTVTDSSSGYGPGHLVAACRAIVAAKLGDTVSVPAELMP